MFTRKTICAMTIVFLALMCSGAPATQYYVSPDGNDLNTGLSWAQAFATIGEGIDTASDDDVIDVNEGTYAEQVDFDGKAITLTSTDPNDWEVVEATIIDPPGQADAVLFISSEDFNSVLTGFTANNLVSCDGSGPIIKKCIIKAGIDLSSSWPTIENNKISSPSGYGIVVSNSAGVIRNNWIYDCSIDGILFSNATAVVDVSNNTIVDNGSAGIRVYSGTAPDVTNCILWDNDDDLSGCYASYSCIEDSFDVNDANFVGSINTDPCFIDADNDNFHLDINSLCINTGNQNGSYYGQTDIDGDQRVYAEIVDIGADEVTPLVYNTVLDKFYSGIQDAIDDANDGNDIVVYPGTYIERVDFDGKAITLRSSRPDDWGVVAETIIDPTGSGDSVLFISSEDSNTVLTGFTANGLVSCNGSSPIIKKCIINDGIDLSSSSSPTIENNRISSPSGYGIIVSGSAGIIRNNWIYDCTNGIFFVGATTAVQVSNNTIVDNSSAGIRVVSGTAPDITNCILWDNGDDLYGCTATYSCIEDCNDANGIGNICGDANDPNFFDDANDNYRLQADSPCVNAGDPNGDYAGQVDINGKLRVTDVNGVVNINAVVDNGGYEVHAKVRNITAEVSYERIQDAIDEAVDGDVLVLLEGIYKGEGNRDIDFSNGLSGSQTRAITVRSTDPDDRGVVAATVIDCEGSDSDGHRGFYFHSGEDDGSVLAGITIKHGYLGTNLPNGTSAYGGGIYCENSSPKITNCIIAFNYAFSSGGGMANHNSSPRVTGCVFNRNFTNSNGGGMQNYDDSSPEVINCVFSENTCGDHGGGMRYNSSVTVTETAKVINCTFYGNYANNGGGMSVPIYLCDPELTNCVFWGNTAYGGGDAIGEEIYNFGGTITLKNCFIEGGWDGPKVYDAGNDILGDDRDNLGEAPDDDPKFVDAYNPAGKDGIWGTIDDGLCLRTDTTGTDKLGIDTGYNSIVTTTKDITGRARIVDGDHNDESGPVSATVDMGAYELPRIWYVDKGNTPETEDGTSWTNAYDELQDALTNANIEDGNEIWVTEGTYKPDEGNGQTPDDRDSTFELIEGVAMYGGFEGDETARLDRDWTEHETILSGDIDSEYRDDSYHVVTVDNADDVVLDGFTVTKGCADGSSPDDIGSGMYNSYAMRLKVANCVFRDSQHAHAMYNYYSTVQITNCVFSDNYGYHINGGGGMHNLRSSPELTNCVFTGGEAVDGAGIKNIETWCGLTNCTFYDNQASNGGAVYNSLATLKADNCIFSGNTLDEIYNADLSDATFRHCFIEGGWNGDGVYNEDHPGCLIHNLGGNIGAPPDDDPEFVNPSNPAGTEDGVFMTIDDGLRLAEGSLCIDVANGDVAPVWDILGLPRIDIDDIGGGTGTQPDFADMGAYEFVPSPREVHFSGLWIVDEFIDNAYHSFSKAFVDDGYSDIKQPGSYEDTHAALPDATYWTQPGFKATLDGIAIHAGTRLIIYSEKDFDEEYIVLDETGPAVIYNFTTRNLSGGFHKMHAEWPEPLQTEFPQRVRKWSATQMDNFGDPGWERGSFEIIAP